MQHEAGQRQAPDARAAAHAVADERRNLCGNPRLSAMIAALHSSQQVAQLRATAELLNGDARRGMSPRIAPTAGRASAIQLMNEAKEGPSGGSMSSQGQPAPHPLAMPGPASAGNSASRPAPRANMALMIRNVTNELKNFEKLCPGQSINGASVSELLGRLGDLTQEELGKVRLAVKAATSAHAQSSGGDLSASSSSSQSAFRKESALPDAVTVETAGELSRTNIPIGPNGFFDMTIRPDEVLVTVRLFLGEGDPAKIKASLQSIQAFWTNRVVFQSKLARGRRRKPRFPVRVSIREAASAKEAHYTYVDLDSEEANSQVNPQVTRNANFSARTVAKDKAAPEKQQISGYHEFGHVLGLSEEYNLDSQLRERDHHSKWLPKAERERLTAASATEAQAVAGSIMGKGEGGGNVLKRHFVGVLKAFCDLIGQPMHQWQILGAPQGGAS